MIEAVTKTWHAVGYVKAASIFRITRIHIGFFFKASSCP